MPQNDIETNWGQEHDLPFGICDMVVDFLKGAPCAAQRSPIAGNQTFRFHKVQGSNVIAKEVHDGYQHSKPPSWSTP